MAAREKKVKEESRSSANSYFKKASDNYDQMLEAFGKSNWNAAATLAVQCAISSGDAVCVYEKGIRSASPNHLDVCDLVSKLPINGADTKAKQLRKVIMRKNMVQYESRSVYKSDTEEMIKSATRFYQWVREAMGK